MKSPLFFLVILFFLAAGIMNAQKADSLFMAGNNFYEKEAYPEAIESYKLVINLGLESAALHYNLGNAYFQTHQIAAAILHYEKAAKLQPSDEEIAHNLNIARKTIIDDFEEMPQSLFKSAYQSFLMMFSAGNWARAGLIGLGFLLTGSFFYLFTGFKRPGFITGLAGLILATTALSLAYTQNTYNQNNQPAIIMTASSYVKSGPGEKAEDVLILHEGTKVKIIETYQKWRKIRLPDGKVGWINAGDIELI